MIPLGKYWHPPQSANAGGVTVDAPANSASITAQRFDIFAQSAPGLSAALTDAPAAAFER